MSCKSFRPVPHFAPFLPPLSLMIVQTDCQNRANVDRDGHKASFYLTLLGLGVPPPRPAAPPSN